VLLVLGLTLGTLLVLSLGYLAWPAIVSVLIAAFFAMALDPAVRALTSRGVGRGVAAALTFVLAFLVIGGAAFAIVPPLIDAVRDFADGLPGQLERLEAGRGPLGFLEDNFHLGRRLSDIYERDGVAGLFGLTGGGATAAREAAGTLLTAIAVPFLTFFMLLDGPRWIRAFLDVVPLRARPGWERIFAGIQRNVGGYVAGNLLISLVAGCVAGVTLVAMGVPYALPLAFLVAILDLVPLIGAGIAVAVVSLAALAEGFVPAIVVAVVLLVYQQVENHVLQPMVYGRTVELSPLAVLVSVLVGAQLAGVLGALAAIPIGGSIAVVVRELVRWRRESRLDMPDATAARVRRDE
jgi:predicted PurR-regulated permease PerM